MITYLYFDRIFSFLSSRNFLRAEDDEIERYSSVRVIPSITRSMILFSSLLTCLIYSDSIILTSCFSVCEFSDIDTDAGFYLGLLERLGVKDFWESTIWILLGKSWGSSSKSFSKTCLESLALSTSNFIIVISSVPDIFFTIYWPYSYSS